MKNLEFGRIITPQEKTKVLKNAISKYQMVYEELCKSTGFAIDHNVNALPKDLRTKVLLRNYNRQSKRLSELMGLAKYNVSLS